MVGSKPMDEATREAILNFLDRLDRLERRLPWERGRPRGSANWKKVSASISKEGVEDQHG